MSTNKGLTGWRYFINATLSGANHLIVVLSILIGGIVTLLIGSFFPLPIEMKFIVFFVLSFTILQFAPYHRFVRFSCPHCRKSCAYSGQWINYGVDIMTPDPIYQCKWCDTKWVINTCTKVGVFQV